MVKYVVPGAAGTSEHNDTFQSRERQECFGSPGSSCHPPAPWDNRAAQALAIMAVAGGRLTIGDANAIGRANIDPNLTVVVDASQLTIVLTSPFDKNGGAPARVTGYDWLTHGNVWVLRQPDGSVKVQWEKYNFEDHDPGQHGGNVLYTNLRNWETRIGGLYASIGDRDHVFTGFKIEFSGSPKIVEPPGCESVLAREIVGSSAEISLRKVHMQPVQITPGLCRQILGHQVQPLK